MAKAYLKFKPVLPVLILLAIVLIIPSLAQAAPLDGSGSFVGLLELIQKQSSTWHNKLHEYALRLFWLLATIQFIWTFLPFAFRGQADISELLVELVKFILTIGFFLALLTYSRDWATQIIDSFRDAAAGASGRPRALMPGDVFKESVELAETVANAGGWFSMPSTRILLSLASLFVLLCFAYMAALLALTIIESYIVINASVLFMGFAGSQWTREITTTALRYAVSVGAKLFVLTLLITLIVDSSKTWRAAYDDSTASLWTLVGLTLTCAYLTKTIPELIGSLISGTSSGSGSAIGGMAAVGVGAAAAAATMGSSLAASGGGIAAGSSGVAAGGLNGSGAMTGASQATSAASMTGQSAFSATGTNSGSVTAAPKIGGGSSSLSRSTPPQSKPQNNTAQTIANTAGIAAKTIGALGALTVPGMENSDKIAAPAFGNPPSESETNISTSPSSDHQNDSAGIENSISLAQSAQMSGQSATSENKEKK